MPFGRDMPYGRDGLRPINPNLKTPNHINTKTPPKFGGVFIYAM
jgi:hypothetical protein